MKRRLTDGRRFCWPALVLALAALMVAPDAVLAAPPWPNECNDGRIDFMLEDFEGPSTADFNIFKADPSIPDPSLSFVPGCHGQALSVGYDLTNENTSNGQSWIVLTRTIPVTDLSQYTHIRIALRSLTADTHHDVQIKLYDGHQLFAVTLKSMADLTVWRPIYIDLRELQNTGSIDLTTITRFEIGIVRCTGADCEIPDISGDSITYDPTGTLLLDEFALVDLKPGATHRLVESGFELAPSNRAVAQAAAAVLLNQINSTTQLVPAWFPEANPNYNSYAQAEALLVFIYEYQRTGNTAYRDAARNLAKKLLSLQIEEGKANAGAWFSAYDQSLNPPTRPFPDNAPSPQPPCDGDEVMVMDNGQLVATNIDACEWVGNVGWVLIALAKLQQSGIYDEPVALEAALARGADWIIGQIGRNSGYPDLISLGTEGNISAYFGLLAAGKQSEAAQLGQALFQASWDPVQRRVKPGFGPADAATAIDVSGSWGVSLLCSLGKFQEALDSQGYSATVMRTKSFDGTVFGYGDIAGPFTVTVEFGAQAAVAGIKDAVFVMEQIYLLQLTGASYAGAFPGAADHWYGGSFPPWNTTMSGVSPTAWAYFAASFIDPLGGACRSKIYLPVILR